MSRKAERPRVVATIEARMGATRLPGKMLKEINGRPLIERVATRIAAARMVDQVVVATTSNPADNALAGWAAEAGVACFRGSEEDVLGRVVEAQKAHRSELVVEICGDMPLIDPALIDLGVSTFLANDADVVTSAVKPGWPQGLEVQVFPLAALAEVAARIDDPAVREHVSLYFYENPERYRLLHLMPPPQWQRPHLRCQLDTADDLAFVEAVYRALEPTHGPCFGIEALVGLTDRRPELRALNAHCQEKPVR